MPRQVTSDLLPIKIAASIMCADLGALREVLKILEEQNIDLIHFDVMDGHFVPNLALSPAMLTWLKPYTSLPFDIHLMVRNPANYLAMLAEHHVEYITVHVETLSHEGMRVIQKIRAVGSRPGVALNPITPISTLKHILPYVDKITVMTVEPGFSGQSFIETTVKKIQFLRSVRRRCRLSFAIEVDGAINSKTFETVIKAGADVLVVGTSGLFSRHPDLRVAVQLLRQELVDVVRRLKYAETS